MFLNGTPASLKDREDAEASAAAKLAKAGHLVDLTRGGGGVFTRAGPQRVANVSWRGAVGQHDLPIGAGARDRLTRASTSTLPWRTARAWTSSSSGAVRTSPPATASTGISS